jgi:hypothetical protein
LQEDGLLSRLLLQPRDCCVRFGRAACSQVDLRVMIEECLDSFFANASIATWYHIYAISIHGTPRQYMARARVNAPVTMMTLPVRSGMSSTPHVGRGGNESRAKDRKPPMIKRRCGSVENRGDKMCTEDNSWDSIYRDGYSALLIGPRWATLVP